MQVIKYAFQQHGDERGQLVALEEFKDIPLKSKESIICMIQRKELLVAIMRISLCSRF